ncbi:diguanylate cyclase [Pseudidiomarina aestuarii]|uniref:diguanylate cyclase n=1 Tax=Pseudidiomarina aestuarii TaxID=624146 RepID=UPI003A96955C
MARTLSTQLLLRITLWSALLVTLTTGFAFWNTYQRESAEQVAELVDSAERRVSAGASVFIEAEKTTQVFADRFLTRFQQQATQPHLIERFDTWFEEREPGVWRLRTPYFDGTFEVDRWWQYLSGFVGRSDAPLDAERKSRIMITLSVLQEFGPAWEHNFANTHVSMPENVLLNYWPQSNWGQSARADLDMTAYSVVGSTLQQNNPERRPNWTGLYFDETALDWVITFQRPIDHEGRHLLTPSHDVFLTAVIETFIANSTADHFVFNQQKQLVAGSPELTKNKEYVGVIELEETELDELMTVYQVIAQAAPTAANPVKVYQDELEDHILVAVYVPGTQWWHVTRTSKESLQGEALEASLWVAALGAFILLTTVLIAWIFIRNQITKPIRQLEQAANYIKQGKYESIANREIQLPLKTNNEIGLLANTVVDMSSHISAEQEFLEREVKKRTAELEQANQKLAMMAHVDGLTALLNRRALDRDLQTICRKGVEQKTAVIMADVDFFKPYNDTSGHEAGDIALQRIAGVFMNLIVGGRVYRYGGEEIVALATVTSFDAAMKRAEKLRVAVQNLTIPHSTSSYETITVSIGVTLIETDDTPETVLRRVDKSLYEAKKAGRNTVKGQ